MPPKARSRPSSDLAAFRDLWSKSKHIVALTGAGISAESGVPTFRGEGGLWRKYQATCLATPEAFSSNPSLGWEFYSYRRELVLTKEPNDAHRALAAAEKSLKAAGKRLVIITQNIDELHRRAGSENVIELHGTLFKTQCTRCGHVAVNHDSPIVPALADKGSPDPGVMDSQIPISELPKCGKCNGLVRPNVVWFGEPLDPNVLEAVQSELDKCDLCLVVSMKYLVVISHNINHIDSDCNSQIGTSSIVYPAAMFAPQCVSKGIPVAEFNIDETHTTDQFG
jgi:NAD-dependent deacetylase sirtuin 5